MKTPEFKSKLFRFQGKGGWTFATIPKKYGPSYKLDCGRTPVNATDDGSSWETSVWTEKIGKVLLPGPLKIRKGKEDGDVVLIIFEYQ